MKQLLELQKGIIYGPVRSRRLGSSLGINILPVSKKVCSFDCVYCQYGWTSVHAIRCDRAGDQFKLPSIQAVADAARGALTRLRAEGTLPAHITLCGNGEPTLHPDFAQIVAVLRIIRNDIAPNVQLSILSNASRVADPACRRALARLDERFMKLDCGSNDSFYRFNKPHADVTLDAITDGLAALSRNTSVVIQSLFATGSSGNMDEANIAAWIDRITRINPGLVHLYTLDRGYPDANLAPTSVENLHAIAERLQGCGIESQVFN